MKISFKPTQDMVDFLWHELQVDYSHEPLDSDRWFCAVATNDHGAVVGALVCEFKESFNVHFTTAIADPRCMSKKLLRVIFSTLFKRAVRITALVEPGNEHAVRQVRRMGFSYEGFIRLGIEGTRDALMFGMLRQDCPFLPGYHPENRSILQPTPPLSKQDARNVDLVNTETLGDFRLRASGCPNGEHFLLGELNHFVTRAALIVGVISTFSGIRLPSGPAQMTRVNAVGDSTAVRRVIPQWGRAVGAFASDSVKLARAAIDAALRVATPIQRQRPQHAVVGFLQQQQFKQVGRGHRVRMLEI